MQCVDTGSQVCNVAWSKHSSELVSTHGYSQNQIVIWKYPSLQQITKLTGHSYRVLYLVSIYAENILQKIAEEFFFMGKKWYSAFFSTFPRHFLKFMMTCFRQCHLMAIRLWQERAMKHYDFGMYSVRLANRKLFVQNWIYLRAFVNQPSDIYLCFCLFIYL